MTADIAMAASARDWPDRLHRFVLDHGGGRVVDRVMAADQATTLNFDVLLIDDVCSFLTPRLVTVVKQAGREVIGVYMPEDGSDAKRRLLECGISDVLESDASPEEFIAKIQATLAHRLPAPSSPPASASQALRLGVTGPCEGVGITEVSVALAHSISKSVGTILVDMDPGWPSVAQRLDLPPHPNIRTGIDHALHRPDRLSEALQAHGDLTVLGGRADGGQGSEISRAEALMLIDALDTHSSVLVLDLGPVGDFASALAREVDVLMVVGEGTPVGVARLIRTTAILSNRHPTTSIVTVANRVGRGAFRRAEVVGELEKALPGVPVTVLPDDPAVGEAAWDGTVARKGRLYRAVEDMSRLVVRSLG